MKAFKIKKSEYGNLEKFLNRIGAVSKNQAFPSDVFISEKTAKLFKIEYMKLAKKEYPYLKKQRLQNIVSMEWLNLGPYEVPGDAIKTGYVLVDNISINNKHLDNIGGLDD